MILEGLGGVFTPISGKVVNFSGFGDDRGTFSPYFGVFGFYFGFRGVFYTYFTKGAGWPVGSA